MNNQQTPSIKQVINYHLTSSLYKRDHPQDEPEEKATSSEQKHTEEQAQQEEIEQNL